MVNQNSLEQEIDKKFAKKDRRKAKKMKVSSKDVFGLKNIIKNKSSKKD